MSRAKVTMAAVVVAVCAGGPLAAGQDYGWGPLGSGMNSYVNTLTVYNDELIAGGYFTTAGSVTCNYVARWNGSTWQPLGSGLDYDDDWALTVYSGELIAGGAIS